MKILASASLAVVALALPTVPAAADSGPALGGAVVGRTESSLDSAGPGLAGGLTGKDGGAPHAIVETGEPGAVSGLVSQLTAP
ncbi:hypothetical protein [Streptomyces sp. NPDC050504]|uniref:hypothetical protein n=1 Tax=Streptomyces sp. NPDC050504 TaxID=3365618 RepID=UPI00379EC7F3